MLTVALFSLQAADSTGISNTENVRLILDELDFHSGP
jgi:hypothetical protein